MIKKCKRIVCACLAGALIVTCTPGLKTVAHAQGNSRRGARVSTMSLAQDDVQTFAENIDSGKCGNSATWSFDINGVLTISGTGEMYDCYDPEFDEVNAPWGMYKDDISRVVIEEGITKIGESAFDGYDYLRTVSLPSTLKEIASYAFFGCYNLLSMEIPYGVENIGFAKIGDFFVNVDNNKKSITTNKDVLPRL